MKFRTYHSEEFTMYSYKKEEWAKAPMILAAEVNCTDLNDVFEKTNTIGHPWTQNDEVVKVHTDRPRSLSVGDVVEDVAACEFHVVEDVGFRKLTADEVSQFRLQELAA